MHTVNCTCSVHFLSYGCMSIFWSGEFFFFPFTDLGTAELPVMEVHNLWAKHVVPSTHVSCASAFLISPHVDGTALKISEEGDVVHHQITWQMKVAQTDGHGWRHSSLLVIDWALSKHNWRGQIFQLLFRAMCAFPGVFTESLAH